MVMVTVQTRNRHELCGVFGKSNTLEDCNEAAAATHRTKVDQSKAKARKGGHVKAILRHIELTLERRGRRWWPLVFLSSNRAILPKPGLRHISWFSAQIWGSSELTGFPTPGKREEGQKDMPTAG